jgi:hypothetical protein
MADDLDYSFAEAQEYLGRKVNIPTDHWNDLWQDQHAPGFMVAGARSEGLLNDLRTAVMRAEGQTLETFTKEFKKIAAAHQWAHTGSAGWRARVIYDTNLTQAYNAGRYKQLNDPDVLRLRPWWRYRHGGSLDPRPHHLAWNGLVLHHSHPWWNTHYPANGWGCSCYVESLSDADLRRLGKAGPDEAPDDGEYEWTDPRTNVSVKVPVGIDPGFAYNPGMAAFGRAEQKRLIDEAALATWEDIGSPFVADRPADLPEIPVDTPVANVGPRIQRGDEQGLRAALRDAIGEDSVTMIDPLGGGVAVGQAIADHLVNFPPRWEPSRTAFLPFIRELIEQPYEIWVTFARSKESGAIKLRRRYVKRIAPAGRGLGLVADVVNNVLVGGWPIVPAGRWGAVTTFDGSNVAVGQLRRGYLMYRRPQPLG